MVNVNVDMNDFGVRFAFDASDLNDAGIKQAVAKTFGLVQRTLIGQSDVSNTRALNPKGITVYVDPETRLVECNVPYMEIRVQMQHVPGVAPHARIVHQQTNADPEMTEAVCSALNTSLTSTSLDTGTY